MLGAEAVEEAPGEEGDVRGALAERGQRHRDRVDPEVEVLAEAALADRGLGIEVGRADEPEVHGHDPGAAEPPHRAVLEHPQELGLEIRRHLGDLVEEQRAPVRLLEQPRLVRGGAGERALDVAEQLGLDEVLGQRRAVDLDQGPVGAGALACTALAASSLPVPLSPTISTLASEPATDSSSSNTRFIAGEVPSIWA